MIDVNLYGMTLAKVKEILSRSLVVYNDLYNIAETSRSAHESEVGKDLAVQPNHLNALIAFCELNLCTTTTSKPGYALRDFNCSKDWQVNRRYLMVISEIVMVISEEYLKSVMELTFQLRRCDRVPLRHQMLL